MTLTRIFLPFTFARFGIEVVEVDLNAVLQLLGLPICE